ncbi:MAG: hypothetical protein QOI62_3659, partial [Solirubrobacteraceae bacterium]|nr:hypothetical protein [Solirubrobacteraceae bacterium]
VGAALALRALDASEGRQRAPWAAPSAPEVRPPPLSGQ